MAPYTKPETSLKRAEELLSLSPPKEKEALEALAEVFASKRFRSTPITALEPVIVRFLELCVSMRKSKIAKEGLGVYRNVAQTSNVPSIETVISKFLGAALSKVNESKALAADALANAPASEGAADEADEADLDAPLDPSTLLMMSVDAQKSRTDRQIVLPALRFYWECLRVCLEVLRNSARLEIIYQHIVQQAFAFCIDNERKTEFRRLCEMIRKDLATVTKYAHQANSINLSDADVLARHIETRFQQLNVAVELELWQEAFRSVEDIQGLLANPASRKAQKPAMMVSYYEKLTKVFKAEGGYMAVFHAAAWSRYVVFQERALKVAAAGQAVDEAELQRLAGFALLSALAVPVVEDGDGKRHAGKLVTLLNLQKMPTRAGLIKEATDRGLLSRVAPELAQLYTLLEVDFHPLSICETTAPLIASLAESADYAQYAGPVKHVVLSRLFQQLSQVYDAVSVDHVLGLVAPFGLAAEGVEKFVMAACKRAELAVRVDHVGRSIVFLDEPFKAESSAAARATAFSALAGPAAGSPVSAALGAGLLQPPAADLVRSQLARLASVLHATVHFVDPALAAAAKAAQQSLFATAVSAAVAEQASAAARRALVARRRELMDELSVRRATEEAAAKAERQRLSLEAAKKKEEEDYKTMQRERIAREVEQVKIDEARKMAEGLKARGGLKVDASTLDNLDTDGLVQLQVEQLEKEKKETSERLRIIAKRVDHIERAFRKEEIPLVLADYEQQKKDDLAAHEALVKRTRDESKAKHEADLALKHRLARMLGDYAAVRDDITRQQAGEFERRRREADVRIAEEKAKLRERVIAERADARRRRQEEEEAYAREEEERVAAEARRVEEDAHAAEEARVRAEIEARQKESEEKAKAAAREAREAERAADLEKVRLQEQRAEEAIARRKAATAAPAPAAEPSWKRPATSGTPPPPSASSPAFGGGERRRLQLAPRSSPAPAAAAPIEVAAPLSPFPASATASPTPPAAAPAPAAAANGDDDGFKTVEKPTAQRYVPGQGKWSRGRGGSTMGSR